MLKIGVGWRISVEQKWACQMNFKRKYIVLKNIYEKRVSNLVD